MDFQKKENDKKKLNKKLTKTANKIRKYRTDKTRLRKETEQFQEIKHLLNISDTESLSVSEKETLKGSFHSPSSCNIKVTAPGVKVFQNDKIFSYFNEKTLCLKDFLIKNEGNVFGKDGEVPNEDLFRNLITCHVLETILPDNEKYYSVKLYVLYLLSVHTDKCFVSACVEFLKSRRFKINGFSILPIYINFGCTVENLIGTDDVLDLPNIFNGQLNRRRGKQQFPYYNAERVADLILFYANLNLIKKNEELKLFLKALTRLSLDRKIRFSRLLPLHSLLISVLSSQLAQVYDVDDIVSCLHLKNEHILNQLEVVKIVHMPISSKLHESLIIKTISFILTTDTSTFEDRIKVKYVLSILENLKEKDLSPLEVYCILQLINGSLPSVTATETQAGDILKLLACLEARFKVKDSIDLIRLKLEVAKLKTLALNSVEKLFPVDYLKGISFSPVRKKTSCSI